MHTKLPQKTSTFERRAKQALKNNAISLKQSESCFHLYIPLTGAHKIATENQHLLYASKGSPENQHPLSRARGEKVSLFPFRKYIHFTLAYSTYPLLLHTKLPQKTSTFKRRAKRALKKISLYIPLTGAHKIATWNQQFWEGSKASTKKLGSSDTKSIVKF